MITVRNSTLTANNSEALVIEGKNSMALENCIVTGNMSDTLGTSSDINVHNVIIYWNMQRLVSIWSQNLGLRPTEMMFGSRALRNRFAHSVVKCPILVEQVICAECKIRKFWSEYWGSPSIPFPDVHVEVLKWTHPAIVACVTITIRSIMNYCKGDM